MRRVVVTGMGVVSPIGNTVDTLEVGLFSGQNGIGPITHFDTTEFGVQIAGEVKDLDIEAYFEPQVTKKMALFTLFAMIAAEQAITQSDFKDSADLNQVGVIVDRRHVKTSQPIFHSDVDRRYCCWANLHSPWIERAQLLHYLGLCNRFSCHWRRFPSD